MNVHVLPETADAINELVRKDDPDCNTQGKIIDRKFAAKRGAKTSARKVK